MKETLSGTTIHEVYHRRDVVFQNATRDLPAERRVSWRTRGVWSPEEHGGELIYNYYDAMNRGPQIIIGHIGDAVVEYQINEPKRWSKTVLTIRAPTMREAKRVEGTIRDAMPTPEPTADGKVPFRFVYLGNNNQVKNLKRKLRAPTFNNIEGNYDEETREALQALVNVNPDPSQSGKLVLWHGIPGTGKTFAVRALAREWKDWARMVYVVDPERFLGSGSEYLMEATTEGGGLPTEGVGPWSDDKWTVFVLEDTGEMFHAGAKNNVGQALSRLLNFSDGILGQGLRCIFLLTTNEPIMELHPAMRRHGRCLANIQFRNLSIPYARKWLKEQGHPSPRTAPIPGEGPTIADLYAILNDDGVVEGGTDDPPDEVSIV